MRAEDRKPSKRVFPLLQNLDLDSVTFAQVQSVGNPISIEDMNEQEMVDLIIVNLARLVVSGEWTGLLEAGGGATGNAAKTTPWVVDLGIYWEAARSAPYGGNTIQGGGMGTDLVLWPFISGNSGTVSVMAVAINSGVTNTMSLCIYSDDDGLPDELLGYGDFDLSGSGTIEQDTFTGTITLVKGTQYWYGPKSSSANQPNMKAMNVDLCPSIGLLGVSVMANTGQGLPCVNTEVAYGDSIPATLTPGNFTYLTVVNRMCMGLEF